MMKIGRPRRNFELDSKTTVLGLCSLGEGRWRITLEGPYKGRRFNESDPRLAVQRFKQIVGQAPVVTLTVAKTNVDDLLDDDASYRDDVAASLDSQIDAEGNITFVQKVDEGKMWEWCRNKIITDARNAAAKLGLPAIANLDFTAKAITPIKLDMLIDTYDEHGSANWRTKGQARAAIKRFKAMTGAQSIEDLNTAVLIDFRKKLNEQLAPAGAAQVFAKIKAVFSFAVKYGLDANQLGPALARLKTLYAPPSTSVTKPQPISCKDFRKLLAGADVEWRAILLLSLNMALYLEDICTLKWDDFDMRIGTYVGRRQKTSVVRVGWLWKETKAAIKALPHKGKSPLLFTSQTGLRFNASSKYDTYKSLRERVGILAPFSGIRDAAYTAAAAACDEKTAKLFGAHKFGGMMDSYVQRRPELVRSAADAVYQVFGPFPKGEIAGKKA